ncbi:MAG: aldose 1-epimerase [Isosphaeraceae bacterium]
MPHMVTTEEHKGGTVYTLRDEETGSSASILPSFGFNLFDLRLPVGGRVRPMIRAFPDFAENPRSPGRNGIPILFPFPNRIHLGQFKFQGKEYRLPINSGTHSIHGFALDVPWEVIEQTTEGGAATLTGRYQISKQSPGLLARWPADAILTVRYALSGRRLGMTVTVSNPTADDLPHGFGIHPYFRCPFAPEGDTERTRVILPASQFWVLDQFIPTGELRPVDDRLDFREGKPMKGLKLDDVLTHLTYEKDLCVCRLLDLDLESEFRLCFDRNFRELVVFTPPGEENVISLEPYTQTTDAVNLASRNVEGGLRILGHGQTESLALFMETRG